MGVNVIWKCLEIRCSEIASEAVLGQKQSRSATWLTEYIASNFWLTTYAFAKPADFKFPKEKVLRLAEHTMNMYIHVTPLLKILATGLKPVRNISLFFIFFFRPSHCPVFDHLQYVLHTASDQKLV